MSNLSQYKLSLAVFSLGLLWVVSEVVGDGTKPGPLDTAAHSIAGRLAARHHETAQASSTPYELAVSQAEPAEAAPPPHETFATERSNPWSVDAPTPEDVRTPVSQDQAESDEQEPSGPTDVVIHK